MICLVTGANGYIGRHVTSTLLDLGAEVIAADLGESRVDGRARYLQCNIFDPELTAERFGNPDVCVHLAWKDGFVHNAPSHLEMLPDHFRFIRRLSEGGVRRFLIMGSMHEVGYYEGKIDENTPCNPRSLYGIAKNALRQAVLSLFEGTETAVQWIRGYYILGDDRLNHSVFTKLLEKDAAGEKLFPFTSGKNKYDFQSVDDLALEIALTAMQSDVTGIVNACSGKPVSLGEQAERFIAERKLNIRLQYGVYPDRPYDSPEIYGDNAKIRAILRTAEVAVPEYRAKISHLLATMED